MSDPGYSHTSEKYGGLGVQRFFVISGFFVIPNAVHRASCRGTCYGNFLALAITVMATIFRNVSVLSFG